RLVDGRTDAQLALFDHSDEVQSAAFSPDGHLIITEASDQAVRLWSSADGHLIETLRHESSLGGSGFTTDMRHFVSMTDDGTVHIWTLSPDSRVTSHRQIAHQSPVEQVDLSKDGRYCITVAGRDARLWDLSSPAEAMHLESWIGVNHAEFSSDGS